MAILEVKERDSVERVRFFVDLAFKDYLAARVLLNKELVLQGTILASKSIEKYCKTLALMDVSGNKVLGQLKEHPLQAVNAVDAKFFAKLNPSFLKMLQVVSKLYSDFEKPAPGFTIYLQRRPILAELDFTAIAVFQKFTFRQHNEKLDTQFDRMIKKRDPRLWENNYILNNFDKNDFITARDIVYGVHVDEHLRRIEIFYEVERAGTDGNFLLSVAPRRMGTE
jgi:hypothetical protein